MKDWQKYTTKKSLSYISTAVAMIALVAAVGLVQRRTNLSSQAATQPKLYFDSSTYQANFVDTTPVKVYINPSGNQVALARIVLEFDNSLLTLTSTPSIQGPLTRDVMISTASEANQSGKIYIVLGLEPADRGNPPSSDFQLVRLKFRAKDSSVRGTANLSYNLSESKVASFDYALWTPVLSSINGSAAVEVNPSLPTPTILPPTPTPSPPPEVTPGQQQITLEAVEDTYVRSGSKKVRGAYTDLQTDNSPVIISFLKFDLRGVPSGAKNATLRLKVTNSSSKDHFVRLVENDSWSENSLIYSHINQYPRSNTLTTFNGGKSGNWVELNLTNGVNQEAGSIFSVAIESSTSNRFAVKSKEASSENPKLIINY